MSGSHIYTRLAPCMDKFNLHWQASLYKAVLVSTAVENSKYSNIVITYP